MDERSCLLLEKAGIVTAELRVASYLEAPAASRREKGVYLHHVSQVYRFSGRFPVKSRNQAEG